jgi:hypothetical protein
MDRPGKRWSYGLENACEGCEGGKKVNAKFGGLLDGFGRRGLAKWRIEDGRYPSSKGVLWAFLADSE